MKLAAEIPTAHLEDLSPLFDFDFVIPHKLLDERYSDFYMRRRANNPEIMMIMDNGFHELGKPLDAATLLNAYETVRPDFLISPDRLDNPEWTLDMAAFFMQHVPPSKLAGNVFGRTSDDRFAMAEFYAERGFGMICFPYRTRQLSWFLEDDLRQVTDSFDHIHFLGAVSAAETRGLQVAFPRASIDTAKPIKWGLQCVHWRGQETTWRGGWPDLDSYSEAKIETLAQTESILWNIAYLRKLLA